MSRSIDERIVEMKFDNKNFESGIKDSLNSLSKLEDALKHNISSDSLDNISRSASNIDLSGLVKSVENISDRFSVFGIVGMRVIENIVDSLISGLGGAIKSVTSMITSGGLQRAMNIENARFQLQGIIKDEKEVTAVMGQAKDSVDGTAYSYDVAAKAASMFAATGIKSGDQMAQSLKGIAGVAATTNSDYESIANIFTKVAGNGRVMGDELLQLSNKGLNAAATLRDYINGVNSGAIKASDSVKKAIDNLGVAESAVSSAGTSRAASLEKAYEAASKQFEQEYNARKKALDKEYKALQTTLNNEYNARKSAYDQEYKALQKSLDQQYEALKKSLDEEYDIKKETFDKEYNELAKSLEAEIKAQQKANTQRVKEANAAYNEDVSNYKKATEEKISLIDKEYNESLKLIDEELYEKTKAIDDEIQSINDQAEAEEKAKKETEKATKLAELNKAIATAETTEARAKAEAALLEYQKKIAEEELSESRKARIKALEAEKTAIKEDIALKKEAAKEKRDAAVSAVQEESTATLSEMADRHTAEMEVLQEELQAEIEQMQEAKTERLNSLKASQNEELNALKTSQNAQLEAMKESHTVQLDNLKDSQSAELDALKSAQSDQLEAYKEGQDAQLSALKEANNEKLKAMKSAASEQKKALSGFSSSAELTEADIRDLVSKGLISFDLFSEAMAETFGDHAKDANHTFTGSMANIRAALARTGEMFYSPFLQQDGAFVQFFNVVREKINDFNAVLGASGGVAESFTNFVIKIVEKLTDFVKGINISNSVIPKFGEIISRVFKAGGKVVEDLANSTEQLANGKLYTPFEAIKSIVGVVIDVFKGLYSVIEPIGSSFYDIFLATANAKGFYEFIDKVKELSGNLKLSGENGENLKKMFKGIFSIVKTVVGIFGKLIKSIVGTTDSTNNLGDSIFDLIGWIGDLLSGFADWINTSPEVSKVIEVLGKTLSFVGDVLKSVITKVIDFVGHIDVSEIVEKVSEKFDKFKQILQDIIGIDLDKVIQDVKDFVSSLFGLSDSNVDSEFSGIGENAGAGFIQGLKNKIGEIIEAVKELGGKAVQALKDFLGIKSPSKVFEEIGEFSIEGLINGLKAGISKIKEAVGEIAGGGFENFGDTISKIISVLAGAALVKLLLSLAKGFGKVSDALAGVFGENGIFGKMTSLLGSLTDSVESYNKKMRADAFLKNAIGFSIGLAVITGALVVLSKQDPDKLVPAAVALGILGAILIKAMESLAIASIRTKNVETALNTAAGGLKKALTKLGQAVKIKAVTSGIKDIAIAIGIIVVDIAGIMYLYNKDKAGFEHALKLVEYIAGAILAVIVIMSALGNKLSTGMGAFAKVAAGVLALSLAVLVAISAVKKILEIEFSWDKDTEKIELLAVLFGLVAGLSLAVGLASRIAGQGGLKTGPLLAVCAMILTAVWALRKILDIKIDDDFDKKFDVLLKIFGSLGGLIMAVGYANSLANGHLKGTGAILAMCAFIVVAIAAMAILAVFPAEKLKSGATALGLILLTLAATLAAVSGLTNENAGKVVMAMAVMVGVIVLALGILSFIKWDDLWPGAVTLGGVLIALAIVFGQVSKIADYKMFAPILAMIGVLGAIIGGLWVLSQVESWEKLLVAALSMGAVLLAVGKSLSMLNQSQAPDEMHIIEFIVGILGVAAIAQILRMVSDLPWETLLAAGGSISAVLLSIAGAFKIINSTEEIGDDKMIAFLVGCLGAAVIGFMLRQVGEMPWDSLLAIGGAVSAVLLSIAGAFKIINSTEEIGSDKIIAFVVGCLGAAAIGYILSLVAGAPWESLIGMGTAIAEVLLAMAVAFRIMAGVQIDDIVGVVVGFAAGCFGVAAIGHAISEAATQPWEQLLAAGISISIVVLAMSVAMLLAAAAGSLAPEAIAGIAVLDVFIADLAGVLAALGALSKIEGFNDLIAAGGGVLAQIGKALGDFVGSIIEGIGEGIGKSLEHIGTSLANFMTNAKPFFDGLKDINADTAKAAGSLAAVILAISAAELLDGISNLFSIFTGKNSMEEFGKKLAEFGKAVKEFDNQTKGIDGANLKNVSQGALYLVDMAKQIPNTGGLVAKVTGDNDIGTFGKSLSTFGSYLKSFDGYTRQIQNPLKWEEFTKGVKYLLDMAKAVPNTGGLVACITGDNDIGTFGKSLSTFGSYLKSFDNYTKDISNASRWSDLAKGSAAWLGFAKNIPNTGGLVSLVTGDNDIGTFGKSLSVFGSHLKNFNTYTQGIDSGRMITLSTSLTTLVSLCKNIQTVDDNKLSTFGSTLANMAKEGLSGFISAFNNQTPQAITTVRNSVLQIRNVATNDKSVETAFNGLAIRSWTQYKAGVTSQMSTVTASITTVLTNITKNIKSRDTEFKSLGTNNINQYLNSIKVLYSQASNIGKGFSNKIVEGIKATSNIYKSAGENMGREYISAIENKGVKDARSAGRSLSNAVLDVLTDAQRDFETTGKNAAIGFANGLGDEVDKVARIARRMAREAREAIEDELEIESPSKVLRKDGGYTGEGFMLGIKDWIGRVKATSANLGKSAVDGLEDAISVLDDTAGLEPVITPIVDLTDVMEAAEMINSMFSDAVANVSGSVSKASGSMRYQGQTNPDANIQNESDNSGTNVTFIQNNNSPNALSRVDIYRQTRNQLAQFKEAIEGI